MSKAVWITVDCLLALVSVYLMYLYLTLRPEEERTAKKLFRHRKDTKLLLLCAATFAAAVAVLLCGRYRGGLTELQIVLNEEVLIWLAAIAYVDWKEKLIPNRLILVGFLFWGVLTFIEIFAAKTPWKQVLFYSLAGGLVIGGVLWVIALIAKSALGMGDVKMFTVLGLLYGVSKTYAILFFAVLVMAIVSIILLILKKATRKTAIPMAPFAVVGFLVNVLLGM